MNGRVISPRELARRLTRERDDARDAKLAAREVDSLDAWQGSERGESFEDNRGHPIDSDYE